MFPGRAAGKGKPRREPVVARGSRWIQAAESGVVRRVLDLGSHVKAGEPVAVITSLLGENEVVAQVSGVVIGRTTIPLVHLATFEDEGGFAERCEAFHREQSGDMAFDEVDAG